MLMIICMFHCLMLDAGTCFHTTVITFKCTVDVLILQYVLI